MGGQTSERSSKRRTLIISGVVVGLFVLPLILFASCIACVWFSSGEERSFRSDGAECIGLDKSMLQDRYAYTRCVGPVDQSECRRFAAAVPAEARSPLRDGWVRCPDDDPTVWQLADCEPLGFTESSTCFVCSGVSNTSDSYRHARGFDVTCTVETSAHGVNTWPPRPGEEPHGINEAR